MTSSSTARELYWLGMHRLAGAYASMLGRRRRAAGRPTSSRSAVIVAPASPGSLGDEAMMSALVAQLIPLGFDTLRIASLEKQDDWRVSRAESDRIELPRGGLGPWLGFAHRIREAAALFVVGADVLDGSYGVWPSLRLLGAADLAARAGLVTTVIGCSYRTQAHPLAVRFLGFLSRRVQVLARDYYSKRRLEAVLQQPTPLVADIAFLLRPPLPGRRPWSEEFTNGFRRNGKPAPVW